MPDVDPDALVLRFSGPPFAAVGREATFAGEYKVLGRVEAGELKGGSDVPLADQEISLYLDGEPLMTTRSDAEGEFVFRVQFPARGTSAVQARAAVFESPERQVTVVDAPSTPVVTAHAVGAPWDEVAYDWSVASDGGRPIQSATVRLVDAEGIAVWETTTTGADGAGSAFAGAPGDHTLEIVVASDAGASDPGRAAVALPDAPPATTLTQDRWVTYLCAWECGWLILDGQTGVLPPSGPARIRYYTLLVGNLTNEGAPVAQAPVRSVATWSSEGGSASAPGRAVTGASGAFRGFGSVSGDIDSPAEGTCHTYTTSMQVAYLSLTQTHAGGFTLCRDAAPGAAQFRVVE